jgi:hypothetical protein
MEVKNLAEIISHTLQKTDIIKNFLKDNLSIEISTRREYDYGNEYTVIKVGIYLNGEEICTSWDSIR